MPRKKDENGKVYAWSDEGFAVAEQYKYAYAAVGDIATAQEMQNFANQSAQLENHKRNIYLNRQNEELEDYYPENFRGVISEGSLIALENSNVQIKTFLAAEGIDPVKAELRQYKAFWEQKAGELGDDPKYAKMKEYYLDQAMFADPDLGNQLETRATSPYFDKLQSSVAFGPKFGSKGINYCIDGLNSQTDDKGNPQPAFDNIMDYQHSVADELRVDYHRQELERAGWNDEAEKQYKAELMAAHEKTIDAFDRLWNMENHGQYDDYLNNELDDYLGKEAGHNRCVTAEVGELRGELRALQNGWNSKDMRVLGLVGAMEAEVARKKLQNRNNENELARLEAFEKDVKALKDSVWDKTVFTPQSKMDVVNKVQDFLDQHELNPIVRGIYASNKEIFDGPLDSVRTLANTMEEKDYVKPHVEAYVAEKRQFHRDEEAAEPVLAAGKEAKDSLNTAERTWSGMQATLQTEKEFLEGYLEMQELEKSPGLSALTDKMEQYQEDLKGGKLTGELLERRTAELSTNISEFLLGEKGDRDVSSSLETYREHLQKVPGISAQLETARKTGAPAVEAAEKTEKSLAQRRSALEGQRKDIIAEHNKYGMDPSEIGTSVDDRRYLLDDARNTVTARQNIVSGVRKCTERQNMLFDDVDAMLEEDRAQAFGDLKAFKDLKQSLNRVQSFEIGATTMGQMADTLGKLEQDMAAFTEQYGNIRDKNVRRSVAYVRELQETVKQNLPILKDEPEKNKVLQDVVNSKISSAMLSLDDDQEIDTVTKQSSRAKEATEELKERQARAREMYNRLMSMGGNREDNSKEFNAMRDALKTVTEIDDRYQPAVIDAAYQRLGDAAQVYSDKISVKGGGHSFFGKNGRGRLNLSNEIREFTAQAKQAPISAGLDPIDTLAAQSKASVMAIQKSNMDAVREESEGIKRTGTFKVKDTSIGKLQEKFGMEGHVRQKNGPAQRKSTGPKQDQPKNDRSNSIDVL